MTSLIAKKRKTPKADRSSSRPADSFDEGYYRRYYLNPATRVRSSSGQVNLANFVFGYMSHLGLPVRRVLDLGCGLGQWRTESAKHHPAAIYQGVEYSSYLCEKLGWTQGSVSNYAGRGQYDLVICQSVFQYLTDLEAKAGIRNLARLCRGAVYLEIITKLDWEKHCNRDVTDGDIFLREGAWYSELLERHFHSAGGGLFLPKKSTAVLYELEGTRRA